MHGNSAEGQKRPTLTTSIAKTHAAIGVPNTAANTPLIPHMVRMWRSSEQLAEERRHASADLERRALAARGAAEQVCNRCAEENGRRKQNGNTFIAAYTLEHLVRAYAGNAAKFINAHNGQTADGQQI